MPGDFQQPQMWKMGQGAGLVCCLLLAALFAGFAALCIRHHLGARGVAFGGLGALLMVVLAGVQWRAMKRRAGD